VQVISPLGEHIPRRALLMQDVPGPSVALSSCHPRATPIVFPVADGNRRFSVLYKGDRIAPTQLCMHGNPRDAVETEIHLLVKVAFFTRSYSVTAPRRRARREADVAEQRNGGAWRDLHVDARRRRTGFACEQGRSLYRCRRNLDVKQLWTPAVLNRRRCRCPACGIIGVSARKFADEQIAIAGRQVPPRAIPSSRRISRAASGMTRQTFGAREFERDGSKIQYQLDT